MTPTQRILVIDDDRDVLDLVFTAAQDLGLHCKVTSEPAAFLAALTPETTLILLDLMMPEMDGVELLRLLGRRQCKASIVLMSGIGKRIMETAEELATAHGLCIVGHLQKPFRIAELEDLLRTHTHPAAPSPRPKSKIVIEDAELLNALDHNQFVVFYQPQIDIPTGNVVGVEALVRWQHPQRGSLIFPDDFIPRLEHLNLIDRLGWFVVNRALSEIARFADDAGAAPMLSINVSVDSLHDLEFPDRMEAVISEHGFSPEKVVLEITESGLLQELTSTLDVLTRLRMKRMKLSIDDFGTGYSMMQQLRNIPATELKIDKSFVQNMHGSDRDRVMVRKTIEIGHDLGMKVIAEGVETKEQLDFLHTNRCDTAQGYLFSRPIPADELVTWLKTYRSR